MVYLDEPYLTIRWNTQIQSVVMEWKKFVKGDDFRAGLDKGLELVREKRAKRWLADLRQIGVVAQEDQDWSNQDWFPRAVRAGLTHMAIVYPENIVARWSVERIITRVEGTDLVIHYFDNVEKARFWLISQS